MISYSIQYYDGDHWIHWYNRGDENSARQDVEKFVPTADFPGPIRAIKKIEYQEVLCVAGTTRDIALPPQPYTNYLKESS